MSKITVVEHLSLDGVMQGPGSLDEDIRDGFEQGGWAAADNDEVLAKCMGEELSKPAALLFGRRTFEQFHSFWSKQNGNPYADALQRAQKYVASRTLQEPLAWENSTLLKGDVVQAVAKLKNQGEDLVILGSGELVRILMRHNLIDRYILLLHPRVLGSGRRLFVNGAAPAHLRLTNCIPTTKGVLVTTYQAAETILSR